MVNNQQNLTAAEASNNVVNFFLGDNNFIKIEVSDFSYRNTLLFTQNRKRTLDGTLIGAVDAYYVPEADFSIAKLSPEEYIKFVQIVNTASFRMECFDYELGLRVNRNVSLKSYSRERLLASKGNIDNLLGVKLSVESINSYKSYDELKETHQTSGAQENLDSKARSVSALNEVQNETEYKRPSVLRWS